MTSTVLTLRLDDVSQALFEQLRREHYPAELNRIPAHVSLFHTLPLEEQIRAVLVREAASMRAFAVAVTDVRSLGRGVAFVLTSAELMALHGRLAAAFAKELTAQDRHKFMPHVVVQNKVSPAEGRALLERLRAEELPPEAMAAGLDWWEYLGGPWRLIERLPFAG